MLFIETLEFIHTHVLNISEVLCGELYLFDKYIQEEPEYNILRHLKIDVLVHCNGSREHKLNNKM